MKFAGSFLILFLSVLSTFGQQSKVYVKVTPQNAVASLDGEDLGKANRQTFKIGFNERKGITEHELVLKAEGYQDYKQVFEYGMGRKESVFIKLERKLPSFDPSPDFYIDIEKVISGVEYSTEVGANTRWKFRFNEEIDLDQKKFKMIEVLSKMGLKTLSGPSDDLFNTGKNKPRTADVLIAGRIEKFTLKRGSGEAGYSSYGYTSNIDINWQFYDRHNKEIIFKETISSEYFFESSLITEEFYNSVIENFYVLFGKGTNVKSILENQTSKRVDFSSNVSTQGKTEELDEDSVSTHIQSEKVVQSDLFEDEILFDEEVKIPFVQLEKMDVFADLVALSTNASVTVIIDDRGHGSGVVVSANGYIVTNHHVIEKAKYIDVQFANGIILPGDIITSSEKYDLALIKVRAGGLTALPIAKDDENVRQGDEVFVVGAPGFKELGQSVSKGIISGKRSNDGVKILQTDTKISPGNSGSPLINMNGEIVGIINAKLIDEGVEGLGFAIDARYLYNVLGLKYE